MTSIQSFKDISDKPLVCVKKLGQFRVSLNQKFVKRIRVLYRDAFIQRQIISRIEKGRKVRSYLFLNIANNISSQVSENKLIDVCLSIEMLHAASILVDDILDGDDVRHGDVSAQTSLGTPSSALYSHFLCAEAMNLLLNDTKTLNLLLRTYKRLTIGEMHDILMVEPIDDWMCKGYNEIVYQKTSAMFEYCLSAAALVAGRNDLEKELQHLGMLIGKLYQISNDYFDMQPQNLQKRHQATDAWPLTFSFPLAIYLRHHGQSKIANEIKQRSLNREEWLHFLDKIWTDEVKEFALLAMNQSETEAEDHISQSSLPADIKRQLSCLVHLIVREDFWYHHYDAQ